MTLLVSVHPKALGAYAVTLSGEINGRTYSILENKLDQLLEEKPTLIVLDMAEVTYLSSVGIRCDHQNPKSAGCQCGQAGVHEPPTPDQEGIRDYQCPAEHAGVQGFEGNGRLSGSDAA